MYFWLCLGYYLGSKKQEQKQKQDDNPYMKPFQSILSIAFPDTDFSYMD